MNKRDLSILATALFLGMTSSVAAAFDVFIDFTGDKAPDATHTVGPGALFTGGVYASIDNTNGGLVSFGAALNFDELVVSISEVPSKAANVSIDPAWEFLDTKSVGPGHADAGGNLLVFDVGLFGPAVHLFDVTFVAQRPGTSQLTWGLQDPTPGFANFVTFDGPIVDGQVNFLNAEVHVVPLPAALPLLSSVLLGCGWLARRRRVLSSGSLRT